MAAFDLIDGQYGVIAQLSGTRKFSAADLAVFNANPEILVGWYFGTETIPSAIVKGADDKVWACTEDGENKYLLEMTYTEVNMNKIVSGDTDGTGNTISFSGNTATIHNEVATLKTWRPRVLFPDTDNTVGRIESIINVTSGSAFLGGIATNKFYNINKTLSVGTYTYNVIGSGNNNKQYVTSFNGTIESVFDCTVKQSLYKITSEYLMIEGTYTRQEEMQYGLQTLALKTNDAGVPTATSTKIEGKDDGRFIMLPLADHTKRKYLVKDCLTEINGDATQFTVVKCTP